MNAQNKTKIILTVIAVVLILGIAVVIRIRKTSEYDSYTTYNPNSAATSTTSTQGTTTGSGVTVSSVVVIPKPIPDLSRPVTFSATSSVSTEAQAVINKNVSVLQTSLKKDPTNIGEWLQLGVYQKIAGDYTGAISSWVYASRLSPQDYISQGNLADLYAYYLHNNTEAEVYYKKSIVNGSNQAYLYVQYATFARDVLKDMARAKAIVAQGLIKNEAERSLLQLQAELNK